jgi:GAF domain-containing protein
MAFLSLIERDREWLKAKQGLDLQEAPRQYSFCAFAILQPEELMEVPDARYDERFHDNPLTIDGPRILYYAGAPIVDAAGYAVGVLAVADSRPRQLAAHKLTTLQDMAALVGSYLELRRVRLQLHACRGE